MTVSEHDLARHQHSAQTVLVHRSRRKTNARTQNASIWNPTSSCASLGAMLEKKKQKGE